MPWLPIQRRGQAYKTGNLNNLYALAADPATWTGIYKWKFVNLYAFVADPVP